jgi:hypothetical protein
MISRHVKAKAELEAHLKASIDSLIERIPDKEGNDRRIPGYCPMGCGQTLFIAKGNYTAASDILNDQETEHIVKFQDNTFTVRHPLRERLDNALLTCSIAEDLIKHQVRLRGLTIADGSYRARSADPHGSWLMEAVIS